MISINIMLLFHIFFKKKSLVIKQQTQRPEPPHTASKIIAPLTPRSGSVPSINLAICLSLNQVQFLYKKKTIRPTLSALKTSPALIINPSENFIPTRKPNTLSQTENIVTVIKVSNHLNPHPSHTIVDLEKKKKKELSIITSWSTNHTTATIINKWLHSAIEQCHRGKHPSQAQPMLPFIRSVSPTTVTPHFSLFLS